MNIKGARFVRRNEGDCTYSIISHSTSPLRQTKRKPPGSCTVNMLQARPESPSNEVGFRIMAVFKGEMPGEQDQSFGKKTKKEEEEEVSTE